jgi:hypothetical protein
MRMLMKAVIEDTQAGNEAVRSGSIKESIQTMIEQLQPEAVYFVAENGHRSVFAVFDMADSSQIPAISEPLFQQVNARVSLSPCMNLEDLQKGLAHVTF